MEFTRAACARRSSQDMGGAKWPGGCHCRPQHSITVAPTPAASPLSSPPALVVPLQRLAARPLAALELGQRVALQVQPRPEGTQAQQDTRQAGHPQLGASQRQREKSDRNAVATTRMVYSWLRDAPLCELNGSAHLRCIPAHLALPCSPGRSAGRSGRAPL